MSYRLIMESCSKRRSTKVERWTAELLGSLSLISQADWWEGMSWRANKKLKRNSKYKRWPKLLRRRKLSQQHKLFNVDSLKSLNTALRLGTQEEISLLALKAMLVTHFMNHLYPKGLKLKDCRASRAKKCLSSQSIESERRFFIILGRAVIKSTSTIQN